MCAPPQLFVPLPVKLRARRRARPGYPTEPLARPYRLPRPRRAAALRSLGPSALALSQGTAHHSSISTAEAQQLERAPHQLERRGRHRGRTPATLLALGRPRPLRRGRLGTFLLYLASRLARLLACSSHTRALSLSPFFLKLGPGHKWLCLRPRARGRARRRRTAPCRS